MLTVAMYSAGSSYEQEAELLMASLDRVGMAHHVESFKSKGDWYANTAEKAHFLCRMRGRFTGPLLYVDVDAFVHANCSAYFERLAREGYDFGAHYYRGMKGGRGRREEGWWMLSGTLFLGDTGRCRKLLANWRALNKLWRSVGIMQGGGQKNLWYTTSCMDDLKIARLPGSYCYAFDRAEMYTPGEPIIIEHTIASRDHRAIHRVTSGRARRVTQLRQLLNHDLIPLEVPGPAKPAPDPVPPAPQPVPSPAVPIVSPPAPLEHLLEDPMREYWIERYRRQGKCYVARAGQVRSYDAQRAALTPHLHAHLRGRRVLDFGCGPGRFRALLEEEGREYVGLDLIPGLGTEPLGSALPGGFDVAVAIFVLQHIVNPDIYACRTRQLFESLNPGGRLIVVDHEPREGMGPHMQPRGITGLLAAGPWAQVETVGCYDGHWIGVLEKAA